MDNQHTDTTVVAKGSGPVYGTGINVNCGHGYGNLAGLLYLYHFCHFHQLYPPAPIRLTVMIPSTTWTMQILKRTNSSAKTAHVNDFDLTQQIQQVTEQARAIWQAAILHTTEDSLAGITDSLGRSSAGCKKQCRCKTGSRHRNGNPTSKDSAPHHAVRHNHQKHTSGTNPGIHRAPHAGISTKTAHLVRRYGSPGELEGVQDCHTGTTH